MKKKLKIANIGLLVLIIKDSMKVFTKKGETV